MRTEDEKKAVALKVREIQENKKALDYLAEDLGVSRKTLYNWADKYAPEQKVEK